jgi:hypothetical protein
MSSRSGRLFLPDPRARRGMSASAWSREEIRQLRELAEGGTPVRVISTLLRRTESAVKNKAGMHGISLQNSGSKARSNVSQYTATKTERRETSGRNAST